MLEISLMFVVYRSVSSNRQSAQFLHEVDGSNPSGSDYCIQGYDVAVLVLGPMVLLS